MYARTIWLEITTRRAEQGLGALAGLGAAPNKFVHSPPLLLGVLLLVIYAIKNSSCT